jgi:hypothetical protein
LFEARRYLSASSDAVGTRRRALDVVPMGKLMKTPQTFVFLMLFVLAIGISAAASTPQRFARLSGLDEAFEGAQAMDLAKSKVPSVVALREVVKIPPPDVPVLVKTFRRDSLPPALRPAFPKPEVSGVTIAGRYVAIIETEFTKEYDDILAHELVHAYITLASPGPLPVWFQEGSAVHFSIDKGWKFYGKPSDNQTGVTIGRKVELPEFYKNKLQNFHFLMEKVGKAEFYKWYREAVMTGNVDARPLLGLKPDEKPKAFRRPVPIWAIALVAAAVVGISAVGYLAMRRERDIW